MSNYLKERVMLNKFLIFFLVNIFLISCSSVKTSDSYKKDKMTDKVQLGGDDDSLTFDENNPLTIDQLIGSIESVKISDLSLYDPLGEDNLEKHTIPEGIKTAVDKWLYYFQTQGRGWYQRSLARSEQYEIPIKNILINYNIPDDLFYLAFIESGFVCNATSRAKAKGAWQFMKGTAKMYGLSTDRGNDERLDVFKSTAAAASHLRDLYNLYGSWYLAMSAYNAGEGRIRGAIIRNNERNFWKLAEKNALPQETMNYVPKYIAATIISKAPEKFGFTYNGPSNYDDATNQKVEEIIASTKFSRKIYSNPSYNNANSSQYYKVRKGDNLSSIAERKKLSLNKLKKCNPSAKTGKIFPGQTLKLTCNDEYYADASSKKTNSKNNNSAKKTIEVNDDPSSYQVQSGDNLYSIAKANKITVNKLKACNNLTSDRIMPGQKIKLICNNSSSLMYTVKKGENLTSIAEKHGITVQQILKDNKLRYSDKLYSGEKLKINSSQNKS